ncbi:winged helix-turn-helix domain-containing protein [Peristeroidobacter soli]|jgi:tetratricopeptide (TPR) repeat protein/DNA-binding winged helix-turn-helix (wHTH) protein|uniref:winged helix-turn-helix domain-containing protein n=1 Tax=Peristeroidobacter soli TaxID=2497877 RepID=UPI00101CA043|nr:winged helix-turn-helix domain-containing protein [Peristeroidobacter soli]
MKSKLGPLLVDELARVIQADGQPLAVSRKGVELVMRLGRTPNVPVRRQALLRDLWPERDVSDKALSMLVVTVRRQLAPYFAGSPVIQTQAGTGYVLMVPYQPCESTSALVQVAHKARGRMLIAVMEPVMLSEGGEALRLGAGLRDTLLASLGAESSLEVSVRGASLAADEPEQFTLAIQSSVRLLGSVALFNVRLVTPHDGKVCWTSGERAPLSDTYDAETALCERLVAELRFAAASYSGRQVWTQYRQSSSFRAVVEGQRFVAIRSGAGFLAAREMFMTALASDPGCAPALVGMADCEILSTFYDGADAGAATQRAMTYVERALALNADLAAAHSTCGFINLARLRFANAERELLRAIQLDESSAVALQWYADFLVSQGRVQEAVQVGHLAVARAPENVVVHAQLGQLLHLAGLFKESHEQLERALALDSRAAGAHCFFSLNAMMLGDVEGIERGRRAVELSPGTPLYRGVFASALARFGERERALQQLHTLEARAPGSPSYAEAAMLASAALGQNKRAIEWFRVATTDAAAWTLYAPTLPMLENLRREPAFRTLLHARGLAVEAA